MIEWMIVLSSLAVICYLMATRSGKRVEQQLNLPPSPYRLPILGNVYHVIRQKMPIHMVFHKLANRYGSMFTFWIGKAPMVIVNDFACAKEVLYNKQFAGRPQREAGQIISRGFQGEISLFLFFDIDSLCCPF